MSSHNLRNWRKELSSFDASDEDGGGVEGGSFPSVSIFEDDIAAEVRGEAFANSENLNKKFTNEAK